MESVDFSVTDEVVAVFEFLLAASVVAAKGGDVGFGSVFASISNAGCVGAWI